MKNVISYFIFLCIFIQLSAQEGAWLNGEWTGEKYQTNSGMNWVTELTIDIEKKHFDAHYPQIPCWAGLKPVEIGADSAIFIEKITEGECLTDGYIILKKMNGDYIKFSCYRDDKTRLASEGLLNRVTKVKREEWVQVINWSSLSLSAGAKYYDEIEPEILPLLGKDKWIEFKKNSQRRDWPEDFNQDESKHPVKEAQLNHLKMYKVATFRYKGGKSIAVLEIPYSENKDWNPNIKWEGSFYFMLDEKSLAPGSTVFPFKIEEGMSFEYEVKKGANTYPFNIYLNDFLYRIDFNWEMPTKNKKGSVRIYYETIKEATRIHHHFTEGSVTLDDRTAIWLSFDVSKKVAAKQDVELTLDNDKVKRFSFDKEIISKIPIDGQIQEMVSYIYADKAHKTRLTLVPNPSGYAWIVNMVADFEIGLKNVRTK